MKILTKIACNEFELCCLRTEVPTPPARSPTCWSPPEHGLFKINCDAMVGQDWCGIGFLVRDAHGQVLLAGSKRTAPTDSVELLEAEAMLWALRCCLDAEMTHVALESDCLALINKLQKAIAWKGLLGTALHNIRLLGNQFVVCLWSHVKREGNKAAHWLAAASPNSCVLVDSISCFDDLFKKIVFDDVK